MQQSNTYIVLTVVAVLVLAAILVSWIVKTPPPHAAQGEVQGIQSDPAEGTLTGTVVATSSIQ